MAYDRLESRSQPCKAWLVEKGFFVGPPYIANSLAPLRVGLGLQN
jgi:hypothetical protein